MRAFCSIKGSKPCTQFYRLPVEQSGHCEYKTIEKNCGTKAIGLEAKHHNFHRHSYLMIILCKARR